MNQPLLGQAQADDRPLCPVCGTPLVCPECSAKCSVSKEDRAMVVAVWNENKPPQLKERKRISANSRLVRHLRARIKAAGSYEAFLYLLKKACHAMRDMPCLLGQTSNGFVADLDWLLSSKKGWERVHTGFYRKATPKPPPPRNAPTAPTKAKSLTPEEQAKRDKEIARRAMARKKGVELVQKVLREKFNRGLPPSTRDEIPKDIAEDDLPF